MKLTPQKFLDSTEFSYLTEDKDSCNDGRFWLHEKNPEPFESWSQPLMWDSNGKKRNLKEKEIKSIDWADFDFNKPLIRGHEL